MRLRPMQVNNGYLEGEGSTGQSRAAAAPTGQGKRCCHAHAAGAPTDMQLNAFPCKAHLQEHKYLLAAILNLSRGVQI